MADQQSNTSDTGEVRELPDVDTQLADDMVAPPPLIEVTPEDFEERARLDLHRHTVRRERSQHIDLSAEEYTPDEVERLLGTSHLVVMHAIRSGELKAQRAGQDVVCIKHEDVVDWLRRRAGAR